QNAARTYVGQDVIINADAIDNGSGGTVVVWSEEVTQFYGTIYSRGEATDGDGGYVEISSRQGLAEQGIVDLSAANGQIGSLLLDPKTITLSGDPNGVKVPPRINFNDPPTDVTVSVASLDDTSAALLLQADNSITVANLGVVVLHLKNNASITLQTRNNTALGDTATGEITLVNGSDSLSIVASNGGTITIE